MRRNLLLGTLLTLVTFVTAQGQIRQKGIIRQTQPDDDACRERLDSTLEALLDATMSGDAQKLKAILQERHVVLVDGAVSVIATAQSGKGESVAKQIAKLTGSNPLRVKELVFSDIPLQVLSRACSISELKSLTYDTPPELPKTQRSRAPRPKAKPR